MPQPSPQQIITLILEVITISFGRMRSVDKRIWYWLGHKEVAIAGMASTAIRIGRVSLSGIGCPMDVLIWR